MLKNKWIQMLSPWVVFIAVALLFGQFSKALGGGVTYLVVYEVVMFAILWLLNRFWLNVPIYLQPTTRPKSLILLNWLTIVIALEIGVVLIMNHNGQFWLALATLIFVGTTEEFAFRGLILPLASRLGSGKSQLWTGVIISSLLFGLAHSVNLFQQSVPVTIFQMGYTFAFGVLLAALYLRTGSLVFPILLHGVNDFLSTYSSGGLHHSQVSVTGIVIAIVFLGTGVFLLRRTKQREITQPISASASLS
ncbi:MAG TPA: hypothetical protein DCW31_11735 [Lactobacillus sp.]|nr:hypothetical protein [Lactobacillus sp.]